MAKSGPSSRWGPRSMARWHGNSDARCALFTCVEYNARGRSAKKVGGTSVEYANDIRVIDGRRGGRERDNYSKVWIRGAYLRDITRQIAILRADLHRTCRDVASQMYVDVCVCARAYFRGEISWRWDVSNYDTASSTPGIRTVYAISW